MHRINLASLGVALLSIQVSFGQSTVPGRPAPASSTEILPRLEKYKAPPYPKSAYLDRETYDYRNLSIKPVPATLTDVFICDIWQRLTVDLKLTLRPEQVTEEQINQALGIYLTRKADDIAGYRPWTHWNFIRSLKDPERTRLARATVAYIKRHGVRDVE